MSVKEFVYDGYDVQESVLEFGKHDEYNCVRVFYQGREVILDDLEVLVTNDEEEL